MTDPARYDGSRPEPPYLTENEVRYENAALTDENTRLRAALTQVLGFANVMAETNWKDLREHIRRQCTVLEEQ